MKDTKLVDILQELSSDDLRQIQKMVRSPFYTSNENLAALFHLLRPFHPDFQTHRIEKKKVFKKLFPKHDYSDIKMRNLSRDLVRILEDYLLYKEINSDDFERKKMLLKIYKNKGRQDWFGRAMIKLSDELDQTPYRDPIYYKHKMDLKLSQLEYFERRKPESRFELLEEWEEMLDNYYLLSKARHKIAVKSLKKIVKASEKDIENVEEGKSTLLSLYQKIDELLETNDLTLFEATKKEFENNIQVIRPSLQVEFLTLLINFGIRQMVFDDEKYNRVVLELYKLGLKQNILFTQNEISDTAYLNIVIAGAKAKEFDWTAEFIESYEKYLSPNSRTDFKTISLSTFYLHKKEYSKAIDLIKTTSFNQFQINIVARMHVIRCYYELFLLDSSYYDLLVAQIDSNERFMRRSTQLPETNLKSNLNFLNFLRKLIKVRTLGILKQDQQKLMEEELLKQQITLSRSWLLDILKR